MTALDNPLAAAANRSALTGAGGISGAARAFAPPAAASAQPAPAQPSMLSSVAHVAGIANAAKTVAGMGGAAEEAAPLLLHGGIASVPGTGHSDTVAALLTPGETVLPAPPVPADPPGALLSTRQFGRRWGTRHNHVLSGR